MLCSQVSSWFHLCGSELWCSSTQPVNNSCVMRQVMLCSGLLAGVFFPVVEIVFIDFCRLLKDHSNIHRGLQESHRFHKIPTKTILCSVGQFVCYVLNLMLCSHLTVIGRQWWLAFNSSLDGFSTWLIYAQKLQETYSDS